MQARTLKLSPLALACALALPHTLAAQTQGPTPTTNNAPGAPLKPTADTALEQIIVLGQAGSASKSLRAQRHADNLITVASADAIGNFPDANASESLQRLVGISIERDQGEGRFVRVRGLAPDYNAVTINGQRVPSPEAGRRAVALDVVPSDLVQSLTVTKALTADMDADSLGGAIDIKSASAFDRDGRFLKISSDASYNNLTRETSPKLTAAWSDIFADETLGVALAGSWSERNFGSDNTETGGAWDFDEAPTRLTEAEARDYQITRSRQGLAANIDWHPTGQQHWYLRGLHSEFSDTEQRNALRAEWGDGVLPDGEAAMATSARELKQRTETQHIQSLTLGGEHQVSLWQVSLALGWSRSDEKTPDHLESVFESTEDLAVAVSHSKQPQVQGELYHYNDFELDSIEVAHSHATDTDRSLRLDALRDFDWGDNTLTLKFGAKAHRRQKDNDEQLWALDDLAEVGVAASQLQLSAHLGGPLNYSLGNFGSGIDAASIHQLVDTVGRNGYVDSVESTLNDFSIDEDVDAAYVMLTGRGEHLTLIGGLRYEATHMRAQGYRYDDTQEAFSPRTVDSDYHHWLPSLIARYELSDTTLARAAFTRSLVRPSFEQMAPGMLLEEDDGELEASFGNPLLQPLTANNIDLSLEHYLGRLGVVSAGIFYKAIDNVIFATDIAGSSGYENYAKAETFINGDKAELTGLELALVKQFDALSAPWSGLLLSANATITDAEASIAYIDDGRAQARAIPFPSQSDSTANLALGYQSDRLNVRVSAAYKSNYLVEVGELDDARYDVYEDNHLHLDFIAKVQLTPHLMVYGNALNLTDQPYYAYTHQARYNAQYERYGRTFQVGLSYTGF